MTYVLRRLAAAGVLVVGFATFVVVTQMFLLMYVFGRTHVTIYANKFGEFKFELAIFALAHVLLPVLLYELDERLRTDTEGDA